MPPVVVLALSLKVALLLRGAIVDSEKVFEKGREGRDFEHWDSDLNENTKCGRDFPMRLIERSISHCGECNSEIHTESKLIHRILHENPQFEKKHEGENSLFSKDYSELHRGRILFTISGTVRNDLYSFQLRAFLSPFFMIVQLSVYKYPENCYCWRE